jgi:HSP20 family protein
LTISAEHKEEKKDQKENGGDWLLNERRYARFLRSFTLPPTVDVQKVDAKLQDGVLKLVLNKREETKPRKIQVA